MVCSRPSLLAALALGVLLGLPAPSRAAPRTSGFGRLWQDVQSLANIPVAMATRRRNEQAHGKLQGDRAAFVRRVFGGDERKFDQFRRKVFSGLPAGTRVFVFGSSLTGRKFMTGAPFDSRGPRTSDVDLVLQGKQVRALFEDHALFRLGAASRPLDDEHAAYSPALDPHRRALQVAVGRPFQLTLMSGWYRMALARTYGIPMLELRE